MPDIVIRNRRIVALYHRGIIRKQIAARLKMDYFAVTKVLQKYERCISYRRIGVGSRSIALALA